MEDEEELCAVNQLPDSVLLNIFTYARHKELCLAIRMVCRRWRSLSHDPELWRTVDIPDHFTDERLWLLVHQVNEQLETLECSKCQNITEEGFVKLAELEFPRLKHLTVPISSSFSDPTYRKLARVCENVQELENVRSNSENKCNPLVCQSLFRKLKVVHDRPVTTYGRLSSLRQNNEKKSWWETDLARLASRCPDIDTYKGSRAMDYVNNEGIEHVSALFPRIRNLDLWYTTVEDEGIERFIMHNKADIVELTLDTPGNISDKGLATIAKSAPNLKFLKLSRCLDISDQGIADVLDTCKKLKELHLHNTVISLEDSNKPKCIYDFSDITLARIGAFAKNMRTFRIFNSVLVTSAGIEALCQGCQFMQGLMLYDCPNLSDASLEATQQLSFLRSLVLVKCPRISPKAIVDLLFVAPSLTRLTLFNDNDDFYGDMTGLAAHIYDVIEEKMALYPPSVLNQLILKGVGSGFVQLITVICPKIQTIDLREGCISNVPSLISIVKSVSTLETLDVQNVPTLEDPFMKAVGDHQKIRRLGLGSNVRHLSMDSLIDVIARSPSMELISMDTYNSYIDEDALCEAARKYHGGSCFLHVDQDCKKADESFKHRFVDLRLVPLKYVASVCSQDK